MLLPITKRKLLTSVVLSIFFISTCLVLGNCLTQSSKSIEQLPLRSITVVVQESQREEFYRQMKNFAESVLFEFHLADYGTNGENVQIWMAGSDVKIIATSLTKSPANFKIRFYPRDLGSPIPDQILLDDLEMELMEYINRVPGVLIIEP